MRSIGVAFIAMWALVVGLASCTQPVGPNGPFPPDPENQTAPRKVEQLYAIAGDGRVALHWIEPGEPFVDHVNVTWSPGGNGGTEVQVNTCCCSIEGLTNGSEYTFAVTAESDTGTQSEAVRVSCIPARQLLFGGSGNDRAYSVTRTSSGEYVIAGSTESDELQQVMNKDGSDVYMVRFGSTGVMAGWTAYGYPNDEVAHDIHATSSDGYVLAGNWEVISGYGDDMFALRLDSGASRVFEDNLGGNGYDGGYACLETLDGGFVFAGESFSSGVAGLTYHGNGDAYVVKLDASGTTLWQQMFGGTGWDQIFDMVEATDGKLVVAGTSYSSDIPGSSQDGIHDFYLAQLDADGTLLWQKMFGGSWDDQLQAIDIAPNGGYIVAGLSTSSDLQGLLQDSGTAYLAKLDDSGTVEWHERLGGDGMTWLESVKSTSDGGYIAVGWYNGFWNLGYQSYVVKLQADGTVEWQRWFGGSGDETAYDVIETPTGAYVVVGYSKSSDIPGAINNGGEDCYVLMLE